MSLFPAYNTISHPTDNAVEANQPSELAWLTNQSFIPFCTAETNEGSTHDDSVEEDDYSGSATEQTHSRTEITERSDDGSRHSKRKHKKKHKKKSSKRRRHSTSSSEESNAGLGSVGLSQTLIRVSEIDYYTDVDPLKIYLTVEKLHRPACPRYRLGTYRALGTGRYDKHSGAPQERYKRYFRGVRKEGKTDRTKDTQEEIFAYEAQLERSIRTEESVDKWIELYRYRQDHPIHFDSYQNHKRELSLIERARSHFPADERLLSLYLEAIVRVHPTDEVLDLIRRAIAKDETNVTLWRALIRNKQCAMAQCIVPDVLKLYERSTRSLFRARRSDETMLQLFRNCATFCRQAGLCELMFGLVQHALSMNVGGTHFASARDGSFASPEHFQQLIEYEELILKSGLPMNEIWLRVELLRGAFHYLPFRGSRLASDPQRMVLNDDVVGFVYPLINKNYAFELALTVLKLMKFPFARTFDLEEPYESDHPEQLLPVLLDVYRNRTLDGALYEFIKQLSVAPSFIRANIAHESYLELVRQYLTHVIDHFEGIQSAILLRLYLQLERMLVCEEKVLSSPRETVLVEAKSKPVCARVKNLLKHTHGTNQNNLSVYAEYGLLEYEMSGLSGACRKIFTTSVQVYCANRQSEEATDSSGEESDNELFHLVLTMVDLLVINGHKDEAVRALTNLALKPLEISFEVAPTGPPSVPDTTKLTALQKLSDRVNRAVRHETQLDSGMGVSTEHHFTEIPLISAVRAYIMYLALIRSNLTEATKQLETFLYLFNDPTNPRQRFVREQIFEIYLQLFEIGRLCRDRGLPAAPENMRNCLDVVDRMLNEYPGNLRAIRFVVFTEHLPWLRLRGVLGKHLSARSVLLLVVAARYRATSTEDNVDEAAKETSYKQRILNLLSSAVKSSPSSGSMLHQNALLWRLYLRELFDQPNAPPGYSVLEQCRRTLYAALEACPWNKALYLDGASCAPQELSQLLDLMVEKQLRVHAIPEELAILRDE